MMKQVNVFKFTSLEDIKAKILEIPYKGKDLSMVLLLPDDVDGLQKVKSCTSSSSHYLPDFLVVQCLYRLFMEVMLTGWWWWLTEFKYKVLKKNY